jgi:hypothetical protein
MAKDDRKKNQPDEEVRPGDAEKTKLPGDKEQPDEAPKPLDSSSLLTVVLLRSTVDYAERIEMVPSASGELEIRITYKKGFHSGIVQENDPPGSPKPDKIKISVHGVS